MAQKREPLSHVFSEKPPAWVEALIGKFPASTTPAKTTVAALASPYNPKSDTQELKELLLDKVQSLDRHFDARIRGLARRNEGQREEITLPRTREGQPRCFTSGQTGHLAINCPERRDPSPQPLP